MSRQVGDEAIHAERFAGGRPRGILRVTIVRETPTQWIDSTGDRWRKKDGTSVRRYTAQRLLLSPAEFAAAGGDASDIMDHTLASWPGARKAGVLP